MEESHSQGDHRVRCREHGMNHDVFIPQKRSGVFLIEALYRTHVEQAESGDERVYSSLGALGYSRWVAWRRFRDAIRSGSVGYGRSLEWYVSSSRDAVADHVKDGWRPEDGIDDDELRELLPEA